VRETEDGLEVRPRPLHAGVVTTYDDHRLATMAAVLGLCVRGIEVADVGTTAKTMPGFVDLWTGMLG
jgi:3-phosphoshikimate 1-carboxyvinyltransferase